MSLRRTAVSLCGTLLLLVAVGSMAGGARDKSVRFTIVADHLNNPRKIFLGPHGVVYVAEAGRGGRQRCLRFGTQLFCVGLSGSIARIDHGLRRVVSGLWSGAYKDGSQAEGPADVIVRHGVYYILLQDSALTPNGANELGPDGDTAGDLVTTGPGTAKPAVLVNFAAFEAAHNPDHGAGPGPKLGDPAVDSDPYAFVPYRGGFAVADAAANDLLWVHPGGRVTVLAVFPVRREPLTAGERARIGAPPGMTSILAQAVPTSVAVGPDGALYVGELTGAPFTSGTARVWRVVPGRPMTVYASGFTTISDLAFEGKNLLVLELTTKGILGPPSSGALIRVTPKGRRSVLASAGLVDPTGLAVGDGSIYISNYGTYPGKGKNRMGELVRLSAAAS